LVFYESNIHAAVGELHNNDINNDITIALAEDNAKLSLPTTVKAASDRIAASNGSRDWAGVGCEDGEAVGGGAATVVGPDTGGGRTSGPL